MTTETHTASQTIPEPLAKDWANFAKAYCLGRWSQSGEREEDKIPTHILKSRQKTIALLEELLSAKDGAGNFIAQHGADEQRFADLCTRLAGVCRALDEATKYERFRPVRAFVAESLGWQWITHRVASGTKLPESPWAAKSEASKKERTAFFQLPESRLYMSMFSALLSRIRDMELQNAAHTDIRGSYASAADRVIESCLFRLSNPETLTSYVLESLKRLRKSPASAAARHETVSLDAPLPNSTESFIDRVQRSTALQRRHEPVDASLLRILIESETSKIPARSMRMLAMHLGLDGAPMKFEDIGAQEGCSRQAVQQTVAKTSAKLKLMLGRTATEYGYGR